MKQLCIAPTLSRAMHMLYYIIHSVLSVAKESPEYKLVILSDCEMSGATTSGYDYSREDIGYDSTNEDDEYAKSR